MNKILFSIVAVLLIIPLAYATQGFPKHPNVINKTLTLSGIEYSIEFPQGTGDISMQSRTSNDFKVAVTPNLSNTTFYTVKSGTVYKGSPLGVESGEITTNTKIYVQGSTASQVVEVLYWQ